MDTAPSECRREGHEDRPGEKRADEPREASFGVAPAGAPWSSDLHRVRRWGSCDNRVALISPRHLRCVRGL